MKILLVIPCYRCEKQISRTLQALRSQADVLSKLHTILILDNQSQDDTVQSALTETNRDKKFVVAINDSNYGLGGSHKVGFQYALKNSFDYMAILHGDDQADPGDLGVLIEKAMNNPDLSAVLGARFMIHSKLKGYSPIRIMGNIVFNLLYSLFTLRPIWDLGSGINIFKISDHPWDKISPLAHGFTFNFDLTLYYHKYDRKVAYVPVTWTESDQSSNVRNLNIGTKLLKILIRYIFSSKLTAEKDIPDYSFKIARKD